MESVVKSFYCYGCIIKKVERSLFYTCNWVSIPDSQERDDWFRWVTVYFWSNHLWPREEGGIITGIQNSWVFRISVITITWFHGAATIYYHMKIFNIVIFVSSQVSCLIPAWLVSHHSIFFHSSLLMNIVNFDSENANSM